MERKSKTLRILHDRPQDLPIIVVVWKDHRVIHEPSWIDADHIPLHTKDVATIVSCGFPVAVTKDTVIIAQSIGSDGQVADLLQILRSCIVKIVQAGSRKPLTIASVPTYAGTE